MSYHRKDILWKGAVEKQTVDFLRFFYTNADDIFDFSKGFKFFNTELAELNPDMDFNSPKRTDILIRIYKKDGNAEWLLVHLEIQGYEDEGFAERVFTCYYRLKDRYKVPVTSLVIYLGKRNKKNASFYLSECMGTKLRYDFNAYYLGEQSEEELFKSDNPFAKIMLIALKELKEKRKSQLDIFNSKMELGYKLLETNTPREEMAIQLQFLKLYIKLKIPELNTNFDDRIKLLANSKPETMDIYEAFEYIEIQDAKKETLLDTAKRMFKKGLDIPLIHDCTGLSIKELNILANTTK